MHFQPKVYFSLEPGMFDYIIRSRLQFAKYTWCQTDQQTRYNLEHSLVSCNCFLLDIDKKEWQGVK